MAKTKQVGDLQINEDLGFQERAWRIQRIAWAIFTLVILLAVLGLFGDGILSNTRVGQEGSALTLDYPRYGRFANGFRITVRVSEGAATGGEIGIQLDFDYLESVQVSRITPTPDREVHTPDGITYVFTTDGASSPIIVYFDVLPQKIGSLSGSVRLQGGEPLGFSQFIYP